MGRRMGITLDLLDEVRRHLRMDPELTYGRLAAIGVTALIVLVVLWIIRDFFRRGD